MDAEQRARPERDLLTRVLVERDRPPERPHAWLQWKGTQVCMDVHCVCGVRGHVDDEFTYYLRCGGCGRTYHVSGYVRLIELEPPEVAEVDKPEGVDAIVFSDHD